MTPNAQNPWTMDERPDEIDERALAALSDRDAEELAREVEELAAEELRASKPLVQRWILFSTICMRLAALHC